MTDGLAVRYICLWWFGFCLGTLRGMENDYVVSVDKLVRSYGNYVAVNEISFQVARGEVFGLLGTNGAGKTSTLEVLEGIAEPNTGQVTVLGGHPLRDGDHAAVGWFAADPNCEANPQDVAWHLL